MKSGFLIGMASNRCLCQMFGYAEQELIGRRTTDFIHPEDRERYVPVTERLFAGEVSGFTNEKRYLRKDGETLWARTTTHAIQSPDGKVTFALGIVEDITDRKRAEEQLRASEAQYRQIFESVTDALFIFDLGGKVVEANPAAFAAYGYAREEMIGLSSLNLITPDYHHHFAEFKRQVSTGGTFYRESLDVRKDGTPFYVEVRGRAFLFKDKPHLLAVVRNVDERKRAEEALRASEERFRSYFEQGLIGMAVASLDKRWLEVNDRLCEILGYSREELLKMTWTDLTHPEDVEPNLVFTRRALAGEIDHFTMDKRFLRKDGGTVYTTIFVRYFRDKGGRIDHVFVLTEDITQRKQAEEALQREHRTLKHMLQSSDHERQLIAYEIHDGLAQHLAAAIMQFDTFSHLKEKQPGLALKAYDAGMTMLRQGHFEARRLISGVRPPVLDESGVVEAIAHLVHEESRRKEPEIESHCKVRFDRLVPILENAIYRIVQESLTNACNHSKSPRVRISLLQRGCQVRIEVRDWGVGFDPKNVPKNRFGLTGIRERARLLGGKCRVRSKPGEGTSIVVELPVVQREEEE
jgi:two-component system sensor histidine kinase UhpB